MFGVGTQEILLILVAVLLLFGGKRLPEVARTLGKGLGDFRRAVKDVQQDFDLDSLTNMSGPDSKPPENRKRNSPVTDITGKPVKPPRSTMADSGLAQASGRDQKDEPGRSSREDKEADFERDQAETSEVAGKSRQNDTTGADT